MSFASDLQLWVCQYRQVPNYPVVAFDLWFKRLGVSEADILAGLDELQARLDQDAELIEKREGHCSDLVVQYQYWCYYCAQLRAHYRMQRRLRAIGKVDGLPH